jgi:hypothetical protein
MGKKAGNTWVYGSCRNEEQTINQLSNGRVMMRSVCRPVRGDECRQFAGWQNGVYYFVDKILESQAIILDSAPELKGELERE